MEQHSMPGFLINLNLGMIRSHVALSASRRQPCELYRGNMPRMARSTCSNRAVVIGPSYAVTLVATAGHCGAPFEPDEWMRRASFDTTGLVLFGESNLLRLESLLTIDCSP